MLDKEVIKFTRNGIRQENLATGETKMLTESDYARQFQYSPDVKEQLYQGGQGDLPVNSGVVPFYRAGSPNKHGDPRPGTVNQSYTYGQYDTTNTRKANPSKKTSGASQSRYYYTYRETGSKIHTHSDLRSNQLKHIQSKMIRQAGYAVLNNLKESDNAALRAVGKTTQSAIRMKQGYRHLKALWNRDSVFQSAATVRNTEFAASKNSAAYKAAYARQNAVRATKTSQETVKQAGKAVQSIAKAVINPATLKAAAIVGAVLLVLLIIMQISGTAASAVVGSVTDHPELTVYVMQLDTDFQTKVSDTINSYKSKADTTVTVEGDNVINTDPNALAILVTGDWTDIQLNEQNKNRLRDAHSILNSYSVSDKESTVSETTDDGQTVTKTVHKVTVHINTYTAKDKIDPFGFDSGKKSHVLQMLDLLDQMNNLNLRNVSPVPGGGSPVTSYDDPQVQVLVTEAEKYLGYPYVWGGSTPATSFDCSGFVSWVYTHSGVHNLPRTTAQGIFNQCTVVSPSDAKPGDLVFFKDTYPTSNTVTHIGIYVGNGRMLHCGDPIQYTSLNKTYWQQHFYAYGRLK